MRKVSGDQNLSVSVNNRMMLSLGSLNSHAVNTTGLIVPKIAIDNGSLCSDNSFALAASPARHRVLVSDASTQTTNEEESSDVSTQTASGEVNASKQNASEEVNLAVTVLSLSCSPRTPRRNTAKTERIGTVV